ncbi:MAG: undecaprenyl/decaprenyl-phosphate alpha-N-acetylglucosaminyl 1-phosphate transferase [Deltaproteobacteria bacterium]|nr:undecaprenyl/decaprenyl-phosphate alpha-N-acetylglucosaminyl 1-phosphate transferase [Candidatus Zymogenaceae bacterium]
MKRMFGPLWFIAAALVVLLAVPPVFRYFSGAGQRWLWLVVFSTVSSFVFVPIAARLAVRLGVMDVPGGRKDHEAPTPLLGGLAVFCSFILCLFINGIITPILITVISASTLILSVGILEDRFGVREWVRLLAQAAAFVMVAYAGVHLRLFYPTPLGQILNYLLSFLWIVGITNAMNFVDGMDGLCAGISVTISFFLGAIAFLTDQPELGWLSAALFGAVIGFFPYNFSPKRPARIFLGDSGSSFLGFVLACLALIGEWSDNDPLVSFSTPLLIFGILIYDMAYTNISRIVTGRVKNLRQLLAFTGHDHFHHRMNSILGSRHLTVVFLVLVNIVFGLGALALRDARFFTAVVLVAQALAVFLMISLMEFAFGGKTER